MAMTVIERFYDSCGDWLTLNTTQFNVNIPRYWGIGSGSNIAGVAGRNAGSAYSFDINGNATFVRESTLSTPNAVVIGFASASGTGGAGNLSRDIWTIKSGGTPIVRLRVNNTGVPVLTNGANTVTYGTGTNRIIGVSTGSFVYCEFSVYLNGASSKVWCRRDGIDEIAETTVDLTGFTTIDDITLGFTAEVTSVDVIVDDIYIHTGTGQPVASDFLGDIVIYAQVPIADGLNTGWDDIPNSTNIFSELQGSSSETIPTSDYIYSASTGQQYTTEHSDLPAAATTIVAVTVCGLAGKGGFGSPAVQVRGISKPTASGTVYNSPSPVTYTLGTTWRFCRDTWVVDPSSGSSWTKTTVDAHTFGFERL